MVSTKYPYGAIARGCVAWLLPPREGKFKILDTSTTEFEVEESIYRQLEEEGVKLYEGRINPFRINQL